MINPVWLRTFCTLVDIGHFTRTAEKLNMTQSGVSQQVRKLEEHFDVPLLVRDGKQFSLTDIGERLYDEAQKIVLSLSDLDSKICDNVEVEGRVRIMSPGSIGLKLYPQLLTLQQSFSGLAMDYRFAPNADVERALAERKIDLGIMSRRSMLKEVECQLLSSEALLLVTPASCPAPSWHHLVQLGFIDHPDGAHYASSLLSQNYPEFQNIDMLDIKGFSNQIHLILKPVSLGLGFTVLPTHAVNAFADQELICKNALDSPVKESLYLSLNHTRYLRRRTQTVIDEVKKCFQEE
ncbi:LysR family transcriptional regulator [Marinomonas pollencensis]|uniref:LysR family transcriptional regulator n=1 Tax=Marinomonas pollencensis TaxID=491954 RepID=A0A3E0DFG4_9GAMM|nr:LysR family transcriptional regulator [Marinomonas pollencensis]REG81293.1 LysR family transcriptional regulator [Marinomonas pollencensis]